MLDERVDKVICLDKLTYASNEHYKNLTQVELDFKDRTFHFQEADISIYKNCRFYMEYYDIDHVMHLAAESHVDRSIDNPAAFVETNITGTFNLLDAFRQHIKGRDGGKFIHVSTDEVFGSLEPDDEPFNENTPYSPRSPYSASKAASDHLARSYHHTYGMDVMVTNCSNNYGSFQHPEKLIPTIIKKMLHGEDIPIYGDGKNIRDWIFVEDHCRGLIDVLFKGVAGETYLFGGDSEITNIDMVNLIRWSFDIYPTTPTSKIVYVKDRPGHDSRYSINYSKAMNELGWEPKLDIVTGLAQTLQWYLDNREILDGFDGKRLGTGTK
tara:strand:- start:20283 stop:21257 length:975 start_codon:yes stop_codon:yes gene_type:complete